MVQLLGIILCSTAVGVEYPPFVRELPTDKLLQLVDADEAEGLYNRAALVRQLSVKGPSDRKIVEIVEGSVSKDGLDGLWGVFGKGDLWLDVLIQRSDEGDYSAYHDILPQFWLELTRSNPQWLAEHLSDKTLHQRVENFLLSLKRDSPPSLFGPFGCACVFTFLSFADLKNDKELIQALTSFARGVTTTPKWEFASSEAKYAAAALLIGSKNDDGNFASLLEERLYDPETWRDQERLSAIFFPVFYTKGEFFNIVVPEKVWRMALQSPDSSFAVGLLARFCLSDQSPEGEGPQLLAALWGHDGMGQRSGGMFRPRDRIMVLRLILEAGRYSGVSALNRNKGGQELLDRIESSFRNESDTEASLLESFLLICEGRPTMTLASFDELVSKLDERQRSEYVASIACARAYFGVKKALIEYLNAVASDRIKVGRDMWCTTAANDLVRGTDYACLGLGKGSRELAQWALNNQQKLTYDTDQHCWVVEAPPKADGMH
jgi:hypothetical protein